MEFITRVALPNINLKIDHTKRGLMVGSCFAESIAAKMLCAKFPIVKNPFGVLYNPASIAKSLHRLSSAVAFTAEELSVKDDLWFSFAHHGSFSSTDRQATLSSINSAFNEGVEALRQADYVVITFGTAWIYTLSESDRVVANCHKLPSNEFIRKRLTVDQITSMYEPLLDGELKDKQVLMTVSPIRHIKDGLIENSLSKATLRLAIDTLSSRYPNVAYFPSFEIMNDELRDYRFYKQDMLHPTDQAVEYIWEIFCQATMSQQTINITKRIDQVVKAVGHRALNPASESHEKFRRSMAATIEAIQRDHPEIDLSDELKFFV